MSSYDPRTGAALEAPPESTLDEVDDTVAAAVAAAQEVAAAAPGERAGWLEAIADSLQDRKDELAEAADEEVALGLPRLIEECGRAADTIRFYASVVREGGWLGAAIDSGPPDLRRVNVPLGPVAVFGAGNFPFGFGVLGHDTATALAAGCPVVAKAHPAHPRLSAALAELAWSALDETGAPAGSLGLIGGFAAGSRLVGHPGIRAVAFTGSQRGGLALWRQAAERDDVIPVFAEMGTVNTAVVTPAAAGNFDENGFVASFTLGMGQFCTKPGLLLAPAQAGIPERVAAALGANAPRGWLLTEQIAVAYQQGVKNLEETGARVLTRTAEAEGGWKAQPTVLAVTTAGLRSDPTLLEEVFGPVALVAEYGSREELDEVLEILPGSLATAVHAAEDDPDLPGLVERLSRTSGRVVVNGWPTGVAVGWAQQHGGPWPATTSPAHTSVGAAALQRFLRPVTYQNAPDAALPPPLRAANPWRIPRRVDGNREQ
ncbi:aldehyde dehydrogenase family protein [Actinoplanes sp. KI2]|uniref:aldehyde dehydrogenase family protein n=1 Tax=Actinoplanes sp. KI2 TaxID=2983315 RepID=UPI0021D5E225|nr:aldehyde dehydrogenase family protein [Actinoplanes sp. KI2]MCU7722256.1 aldehyde dehydrogenase family protein [Actinoplanes sp. KI2]